MSRGARGERWAGSGARSQRSGVSGLWAWEGRWDLLDGGEPHAISSPVGIGVRVLSLVCAGCNRSVAMRVSPWNSALAAHEPGALLSVTWIAEAPIVALFDLDAASFCTPWGSTPQAPCVKPQVASAPQREHRRVFGCVAHGEVRRHPS